MVAVQVLVSGIGVATEAVQRELRDLFGDQSGFVELLFRQAKSASKDDFAFAAFDTIELADAAVRALQKFKLRSGKECASFLTFFLLLRIRIYLVVQMSDCNQHKKRIVRQTVLAIYLFSSLAPHALGCSLIHALARPRPNHPQDPFANQWGVGPSHHTRAWGGLLLDHFFESVYLATQLSDSHDKTRQQQQWTCRPFSS